MSFGITGLGCLLVDDECNSFTTRNGNGRTKDLRMHIKKKHFNEYNTATKSKQLKAFDASCVSESFPQTQKDPVFSQSRHIGVQKSRALVQLSDQHLWRSSICYPKNGGEPHLREYSNACLSRRRRLVTRIDIGSQAESNFS